MAVVVLTPPPPPPLFSPLAAVLFMGGAEVDVVKVKEEEAVEVAATEVVVDE